MKPQNMELRFASCSVRLWLAALALFAMGLASLFIPLRYPGELYYRYGGSRLGELSLWFALLAIGAQGIHLARVRTLIGGAIFAANIGAGALMFCAVWIVYAVTHSGI